MRRHIRKAVRELEAYVGGEQPRAPGVIKLNTNENPYPPAPGVAAALARLSPGDLRLYPDPVCRELRETLARYHDCGTEHIFVGNGSDEVLALCLRAFVEPEGTVGFFDPSYSLYPVLCAIEERATRPVALGPRFQWRMPAGYETDLFFLTNPNAPTSMLFPGEKVGAFCRSFPGVVVLDEAYVDFAREHGLALALERENVLVARSFSKSFSLAGLRVGYAVGAPDLVAALYKIKDSYNVDLIAQRLAAAAIEEAGHMRANRDRILRTRRRMAGELKQRSFDVAPSETNFLWVRPPAPGAPALFEALRERGVYVRHFPGPRTEAYLRITVGTDPEMDRFLAILDEIGAEVAAPFLRGPRKPLPNAGIWRK